MHSLASLPLPGDCSTARSSTSTFGLLRRGRSSRAWTSGVGLGETLARYAAFYVVTSLGWDLVRAVGNVALILLLGAPTVRALARFRRRFHFEIDPKGFRKPLGSRGPVADD